MQRIREQLADWQAAIGYAPTLPGVDPARLAIWSFSASSGQADVLHSCPSFWMIVRKRSVAYLCSSSRSAARTPLAWMAVRTRV